MRVTETIGPAWETMKRVLFRPFNLGTWFSFGLVFAFQSCAEGGGGGGNNLRIPDLGSGSGHGGSGSGDDTANAITSALPHGLGGIGAAELAVLAAIAVVVAIPLVVLMWWLGSRGQMMAIRAVATGRPDFGEAWHATHGAGGRMFKFHLAVSGIALLVFVPLLGIGAAVTLPVIRDERHIETILPWLIALGLVAIVAMIPLAIVSSLGRSFVAPIMWKHEIGAREAWRRFWSIGKNHVGPIVVFWLIGGCFAIAAGIVGLVGGFLTCCLGFLPILHQTILAPYYVFERAWTLEILASMSPDFDCRAVPTEAQGPSGFGPPGGFGYGGHGPPGGFGGPPGYGPPGPGFGGPPPPAGGFGGPPPYGHRSYGHR